jgi:transcriptional regulator with XRE-family HTH domain
MEPNSNQRHELGAFLRARREALPGPATGRRRTPGLRREEVAALSNVSTTWYIWAEQGRDISLSPQALSRLALALKLTPAERTYLFALAARLDPNPPHEPETQQVPPDLAALPEAIATPAYILDASYNGCAWNAPARDLFVPWLESGEVNLLRYVFLQESARSFIQNWPERAHRLAAEFHAETGQKPEAPARRALVETLLRESTDFASYWRAHTVLSREGGARSFIHPQRGALHYTQHNLTPAAHPSYLLVILAPNL